MGVRRPLVLVLCVLSCLLAACGGSPSSPPAADCADFGAWRGQVLAALGPGGQPVTQQMLQDLGGLATDGSLLSTGLKNGPLPPQAGLDLASVVDRAVTGLQDFTTKETAGKLPSTVRVSEIGSALEGGKDLCAAIDGSG